MRQPSRHLAVGIWLSKCIVAWLSNSTVVWLTTYTIVYQLESNVQMLTCCARYCGSSAVSDLSDAQSPDGVTVLNHSASCLLPVCQQSWWCIHYSLIQPNPLKTTLLERFSMNKRNAGDLKTTPRGQVSHGARTKMAGFYHHYLWTVFL